MLEQRKTFKKDEIGNKRSEKESLFKRGNGRDLNAQKGAESRQKRREEEDRDQELQEYEIDQEADVKGG